MKERFCRSDELKYLLLGERGCQVPSDFIVFRIFSFHFLLLTSICILISFSRWEAPRSPAASFSLLYHRYLSPPLSPSLQTEQIFTKRRQKRIFRHLEIWIILKEETQIFASELLYAIFYYSSKNDGHLFVKARLKIRFELWSNMCSSFSRRNNNASFLTNNRVSRYFLPFLKIFLLKFLLEIFSLISQHLASHSLPGPIPHRLTLYTLHFVFLYLVFCILPHYPTLAVSFLTWSNPPQTCLIPSS